MQAAHIQPLSTNPSQVNRMTLIANTWNSGLTGQGEIVGNILIAAGTIGGGTTAGSLRIAEISEGTLSTAVTDASFAAKLFYYEIGQKTFATSDFLDEAGYSGYLNAVDRGAAMFNDQGLGALMPQGSGWILGIPTTIGTGPTPLGLFGVAGLGAAELTGQVGQFGQQTSFSGGSSTGK
jgi:hypothetical protein